MSDASEAGWWRDYFDERFAALYRPFLPPDDTRAEVEAVREALGLEPGTAVLDLACGWGRHALELARAGVRVTGLDRSATLLRMAREAAERDGLRVDWVRADMREIPFRGAFDAVLSLFSSLGYFLSDAEDVRVLRGARAALRPDGLLLLETMHRDQVVREYAQRDWWEGEAGEVVWVEREFDAVAGISHERLRWRGRQGEGEKRHALRVRTATEWAHLLEQAGLEAIGWYGDWTLEPFDSHSPRLIVVARSGAGGVADAPSGG